MSSDYLRFDLPVTDAKQAPIAVLSRFLWEYGHQYSEYERRLVKLLYADKRKWSVSVVIKDEGPVHAD